MKRKWIPFHFLIIILKWILIFLLDYNIEIFCRGWRSCSVSGRVRSARRHGWAPLFLALPGSGSPRQSTERQPWKLSGDTADWKSVLTVPVAGWADIATTVIQVVRVSTWVSSTRPQVAAGRLIEEAAATEEAAPSSIKWRFLYVTVAIRIPIQCLSRRPKTTSNTLFY